MLQYRPWCCVFFILFAVCCMPHQYVLLLKPNTNIPFFEEMKRLCLYEFQIMCDVLSLDIEVKGLQMIGQGCYLSFRSAQPIDPFFQWFTRLSFYYTLFSCVDSLWKPIDISSSQVFPDDLSNRLKYSGKTNYSDRAALCKKRIQMRS